MESSFQKVSSPLGKKHSLALDLTNLNEKRNTSLGKYATILDKHRNRSTTACDKNRNKIERTLIGTNIESGIGNIKRIKPQRPDFSKYHEIGQARKDSRDVTPQRLATSKYSVSTKAAIKSVITDQMIDDKEIQENPLNHFSKLKKELGINQNNLTPGTPSQPNKKCEKRFEDSEYVKTKLQRAAEFMTRFKGDDKRSQSSFSRKHLFDTLDPKREGLDHVISAGKLLPKLQQNTLHDENEQDQEGKGTLEDLCDGVLSDDEEGRKDRFILEEVDVVNPERKVNNNASSPEAKREPPRAVSVKKIRRAERPKTRIGIEMEKAKQSLQSLGEEEMDAVEKFFKTEEHNFAKELERIKQKQVIADDVMSVVGRTTTAINRPRSNYKTVADQGTNVNQSQTMIIKDEKDKQKQERQKVKRQSLPPQPAPPEVQDYLVEKATEIRKHIQTQAGPRRVKKDSFDDTKSQISEYNVIYGKFNDEIQGRTQKCKSIKSKFDEQSIIGNKTVNISSNEQYKIPNINEYSTKGGSQIGVNKIAGARPKSVKQPDDMFKAKREVQQEREHNKKRIENLMSILGEELEKDESKPKQMLIPKLKLPTKPDDFPFDAKKRREALLNKRRVNNFKNKY